MAMLHAVVWCALAAAGDPILLDFHTDWCGPCRQMDPIVRQLESQGYPVRRVNGDQQPDLRAQYNVNAYPTFILVADGREAGRIEGMATREQLVAMFEAAQPPAVAGQIRGQSPDDGGMRIRFPSVQTSTPLSSNLASPPSAHSQPNLPPSWSAPASAVAGAAPAFGGTSSAPAARGANDPFAGRADTPPSIAPPAASPAANAGAANDPIARMMAASVRIRVDDGTVGSGTIIDSRQGEALVVTCGHLFRDSRGKGRITIDLFGAGAPEKLPAELVSYNLDDGNDVALISFRPPVAVTAAPLAPRSYQPRENDPVVSVGCDHGAPPSPRQSQVKSIDRFLGPPNIQVFGQPVQGRSGGGLFTNDGQVIGVCNCADPADDQGLFAALESIHREVDRAGLTQLLAQAPADRAIQVGSSPAVAGVAASGAAADWNTAPMAAAIGTASAALAAGASGAQISADALAALTPQERLAIEEMRQRAAGAEVICIVRPLGDARAKSEVFVLDKVSAAFIDQLYADRVAQDGRFMTSANGAADAGATASAAEAIADALGALPPLSATQPATPNAAVAEAAAVVEPAAPSGQVAIPRRTSNWQPNWRRPAAGR